MYRILHLLLAVFPLTFLTLTSPGGAGAPSALAQTAAPVCQWQLVDTSEALSTGSLTQRSGGTLTTSYTYPGNQGCDDQVFNTTHTWTEPGDLLTPGDMLIFDVGASWENVGNKRCSSLTAGLHTSESAGLTTVSAGESHIIVSVDPSGSVSNSGSWVVPSGSAEGATMNINAGGNTGFGGGAVIYKYQYVCASPTTPPTDTPEPTVEPTATPGGPCTPVVSNLDNLKPGDTLSPAASYVDASGQSVGVIGEAWFINGVERSSTVWNGDETVLELQYTCLDHSGHSKTFIIPAYGATQPSPTPQDTPQAAGSTGPASPPIPGGLPGALAVIAVVVGVGGAGVTGGAVLVSVLKNGKQKTAPPKPPQKKKGKGKQDQKKEQLKSYYLTANASQLTLEGGQSRDLQIEAWEVVAGGNARPCSAGLQIGAPPQSGLTVTPASGQGKIHAKVSASRSIRAGSYLLQVHGRAPDGRSLSASIQVHVHAEQYTLECDPQEFELRPSEEQEVEISLWRWKAGGQELAEEIPVRLELFGQDNPLEVDPLDGAGKFQCTVGLPRDGKPRRYYIQAIASPPDQDEIKTLITVQALPPPTLAVVFDKVLWEPDSRTDLYSLKDLDAEALDALAAEGGQLLVRAFGEYRGAQDTIRCAYPIEDGDCRLERDGQTLQGVWEETEYGYRIQVPPLAGREAGDHALRVDVPIPVARPQVRSLDGILKNARRAGNALGQSLSDRAVAYVQDYLETISRTETRTLASRKRELLTWLFNTAAFTRYSAESIDAFKLALNLHESAYRRFFNAIINFILEILFLLLEKLASKAWRAYARSGGEAVQESVEAQTREAIEEMLEKESRALAEQNQTLEGQLKQATEESSETQLLKQAREEALVQSEQEIQRIQREIAEEKMRYETRRAGQQAALAEAKAAKDEAWQRAVEREMQTLEKAHQEQMSQLQGQLSQGALGRENVATTIDALETEINRKTLELQKLAGELQGVKSQLAALEQMQQGVRGSKNLKGAGEALSGTKPGPTALDPQIQASLEAFIDKHWKQLDDVIHYLENNRGRLGDVDALIGRVRALQASLRKELGAETIKMTYNDFVIKPEMQQYLREINQANSQAKQTVPGTEYRAVERQHYDEGVLGWLFYGIDKGLEWLYPLHEWARQVVPGIALAEDLIAMACEAIMEQLVKVSNLAIEFLHRPDSVRSVIAPDLRSAGIGSAKSLGLDDSFFRFPGEALRSLGQHLNPQQLTNNYTNRASMQRGLTTGAENGYRTERGRQQSQAFLYFENTLLRALTHGFENSPDDLDLSVSVAMIGRLECISQTMEAYVKGFQTAESSGGEALANLDARLWEAKEWTAQDLDTLVEWVVWGLQSLAILLGALGLLTGVGAAAGAAMLGTASLISLIGAHLRVGIVALWTLPNIVGFQYDLIAAHVLMYAALYEGESLSPDELIVDRYFAGD